VAALNLVPPGHVGVSLCKSIREITELAMVQGGYHQVVDHITQRLIYVYSTRPDERRLAWK